MKNRLILGITILFASIVGFAQGGVEIEYLANEGVVINSTQGKVIIDGIHTYYKDDYAYLSEGQVAEVLDPSGRFASTKIVLVSHVHGDHFTAPLVADFMKVHRGATLVSSMQVIDSLNLYGDADLRQRLNVVDHKRGKRDRRFIGRIYLETIGLKHSEKDLKWTQNLGHIVTIDGVKILHVGDAALSFSNYEKLDLEKENFDIAIVPYWYAYQPEVLKEYINAGSYILAHISPGDTSIREEFATQTGGEDASNYIIFDEVGQKVTY
jgi:L-ascorbate metabolism protein UlaG (beta-lactamase superfamily)